MKKGNKTYWKGIEQLKNDKEFIKNAHNEFPEYLPINGSSNNSRRDFLKMMGFGLSAATLASCEAPIKKAIPYERVKKKKAFALPRAQIGLNSGKRVNLLGLFQR